MGWRCGACGGDNPEGMRFCGHCGKPAEAGAPEDRRKQEKDVTEALRSFVSAQVADKLLEGGGGITDERRLVTCLFADLSGFTPLADRLDPEELLEVIDPIIEELTSIVGRYEGYVDKFAGDALLAFFGAPTSHEDDAERALAVAEEMHARLARMLPDLPPDAGDLTLHIGVNTGHVIARVLGNEVKLDYSVLGDAVILAQRLESAAPAGETYVGTTTHLLTKHAYRFEGVGELTLKGKKEPVPAWRLVGRRSRRSHLKTKLVGRSSELEALESALERGKTQRALAAIVGAPGLGKTALLQSVRRQAEAEQRLWLQARCLPYGAGISYWPFMDVIRRVAGIAPSDPPGDAIPRLRKTLEGLGLDDTIPYIARLLGYPAPELAHHRAEDFRRELHAALARGMRDLTGRSPLVLVLEDAHWADQPSVELVGKIAEACSARPLTMFLTARPEGRNALHRVLDGVDADGRRDIELQPLDTVLTGEVIGEMLGSTPPDGLSEVIWERTGGNPLFTHELVRSLLDSGTLRSTEGAWILDGSVEAAALPPTVEGVLSARMDLLPRGVAPTLQIASVIGRRVRLKLLQELHPEPSDVPHHLELLVETGFLEEDGDARDGEEPELVFHHALMQDVAYARLLRKTKRKLHQQVADAAERLYGAGDDSIDLLARHLYLGERGPKAIDYLIRAGERSASLFANNEALMHLTHAAELIAEQQDHPRAVPVALTIADLRELTGDYGSALAMHEAVIERSPETSEAWRGKAGALRNLGRYEEALAAVTEAEERGLGQTQALLLEKGRTLARLGRTDEALAAFRAALEADGDPATTGETLLQIARSEAMSGDAASAVRRAEQARRVFAEAGDLRREAISCRIMGEALGALGDEEQAAEVLRKGLELAQMTGNAEEQAGCLINLGLVLPQSQIEEAIRCDIEAIEAFKKIGIPTGEAIGYGNLADKLMRAGRYEEALERCDEALELARRIGDRETVADATNTIGLIEERRGSYEAAAEAALEAAEIFSEVGAEQSSGAALELAARCFKALGDEERARSAENRARLALDRSIRN